MPETVRVAPSATELELSTHKPVWVRVNTQVDAGIAEIVSLLSGIAELETVESCEGYGSDAPPFVYFHYGDWERLCRFMFVTLGPRIHEQIGGSAVVSVEVFNGSLPLGKLTFDKQATPTVTSVLKDIVQSQ
jgi:hypothetical protein